MAASSSLQSNHRLNEIYRSHSGRGGTLSSAIPVAGTGSVTVGALVDPGFARVLNFFDSEGGAIVTAGTMIVEV